MSKLIVVGSSNIRNMIDGHRSTFEKSGFKCDFRPASAFNSGIKTLADIKEKSYIIAAFLTNGIVDATVDENNLAKAMEVVKVYAKSIIEVSLRTESYVWVLRPLLRQSPSWLARFIPEASKVLEAKLSHIKNIRLLPYFEVSASYLKLDGTHLNQTGLDLLAMHFHKHVSIIRGLGEVSPPVKRKNSVPIQNAEKKASNMMEVDVSVPPPVVVPPTAPSAALGIAPSTGILDPQLQMVVQSISSKIETTFNEHKEEVNVAIDRVNLRIDITVREIARQAESSDNAINLAKAHMILVSGLEGKVKPSRDDRNSQARTEAQNFLNKLGVDKKNIIYATFLTGTNPGPQKLPLLRIALRCVGSAHQVREAFTRARLENRDKYRDVYINPEHTKATRVRISIMQLIGRKLATLDDYKAYQVFVTKFEPCPELCFRNKTSKQFEKRMSFVDACERFASLLSLHDLEPAKKVAGRAFGGRLNTLFLVWGKCDEQNPL